jgi:GNAT superfamily N-acetyltransferase
VPSLKSKKEKMSEISNTLWRIRQATPEDIPEILAMVHELAAFERLSHEVVATEADYRESLFGARPAAGALLAEDEGAAAGYAIHYETFSSFLGRPGLWLEDLYVRPAHRGRGLGKALLRAVGAIARERGAGRYEWTVLDWNEPAIGLYEQMGGEVLPDWRIVRMDRERIRRLLET